VNTKRLLIIFAVFSVIVSFYLIFEKFYLPKHEEKKIKELKLFSLSSDDLDAIVITRGEKKISLEKDADGIWALESPIGTDADPGEVETFITAALDAETKRDLGTLSELGAVLSNYGLDAPALSITLSSGATSETVHFGEHTPSGEEIYVYKGSQENGDPSVFLIYDAVFNDLDLDVTTFRDRRLLAFIPDEVKKVSLKRHGVTTAIELAGDDTWNIKEPYSFPANQEEVEALILTITDSRAVSFVTVATGNLFSYGLDNPDISIAFYDADGKTSTLYVGKKDENGNYYARREGRSEVFTIEPVILESLDKSPESFMNNVVFVFAPEDVSSFSIATKDGTLSVKKAGDSWEIIKPEKLPGDRNAIADTLWNYLDLRFKGIAENTPKNLSRYGLDNPSFAFSVTYTTDDAKRTEKLIIGKTNGDIVYGYLPDNEKRNFVFTLTSEAYGKLSPTLSELKDKSLLSFTNDDVFSISIKWDDKSYELIRKKNKWKMVSPDPGRIDEENVKYLLMDIADIAYTKIISESADDAKIYGLSDPRITITLKSEGDTAIGSIMLGNKVEGEEYIPARSSTGNFIYAVSPDLVDDLHYDLTTLNE